MKLGVRQKAAEIVKIPIKPDEETRQRHNVTHVPYAPWCSICVRARAKDDPHRKQIGKEDAVDPEISLDFFNFGLEAGQKFPSIAITDHTSGCIMASGIRAKDAD